MVRGVIVVEIEARNSPINCHCVPTQSGSIAIIERFWRTMKEMLLLKLRPPLSIQDLWHRVEVGLVYYALWKPHQGLSGATPAEMYYGVGVQLTSKRNDLGVPMS